MRGLAQNVTGGDLSDTLFLCYLNKCYNRIEASQGLCGGCCCAIWMRYESKASEESLVRRGWMWCTAEGGALQKCLRSLEKWIVMVWGLQWRKLDAVGL